MRIRVVLVALLIASAAMAQDDPVARARELAISGQRVIALRMLEVQLLRNPGDNDARTLYGTVLSWEGRFAEARQELRIVLARDPQNADAREALERVELWSSSQRARQESLLSVGATFDRYEDGDDWQETFLELKKPIRFGAVVARAAHAERFGLDDDQFEIQFYPRVGRRGWAALSAAYASDAVLYPETRLSAELYHAIGKGFEASAGVSRLDFSEGGAVSVYTGSLGKYVGNWLIGGRGYEAEGNSALQGFLRRFFGEHGQYIELRFGEGTTRDTIRSATDIEALDVREIAVETLLAPGRHWMFRLRAGAGQTSDSENRFSLSAAFGRRF